MSGDLRPDPDRLLARLRGEAARAARGRLKIFLGATPGVGKTFAMLEAAAAARRAGRDVVVGVVETHGRVETAALLDGLERLPRTTRLHRGLPLEEFALDAALARHPALLLVDELAHTNAPGSRHVKRWQDVRELLAAGIDVHTTLNVQHIESLNDVVAQITGVRVRETVPDAVVDEADEIELVDVSPDVLLERLRAGKVYLPEQAERAMQRFFQRGNLIALRELALRRTAERVDAEMRDWREAEGVRAIWPAGERVLVAVPPGAEALHLVRAAWRLATSLRAECVAIHVETPAVRRLGPAAGATVAEAFRLADSLGVRTITLTGVDVATELLHWARGGNATRIVVGVSRRRGPLARWRRSPVDRLLAEGDGLDLVVLGDDGAPTRSPATGFRPHGTPREYALAAAAVVGAGLGALLIRDRLSTTDIAMLFLLAVAWVGTRVAAGPGVFAAVLAIGVFDFAFVPPYYTFAVSDVRYVLTFLVMLAVAVGVSWLAGRGREQAEAARHRERGTALLLDLAEDLAAATGPEGVAAAVRRRIVPRYGHEVRLLLEEAGELRSVDDAGLALDEHELAVAYWAWRHGERAGTGTATLPAARGRWFPLAVGGRRIGALGLVPTPAATTDAPLVEAAADQAAAACERVRLAERTRRDQVEIASERLRTALLSSLSHDLRTPLAGVEGAATTLLGAELPAETRRDLLTSIVGESRRMGRLIGNLLEMVRMESGALQVNAEWQAIDEVIGVALLRADAALAPFRVEVRHAPDLPLLRIDGLLIEQVLVNLLENAARHASTGSIIEVESFREGETVRVEVRDRGPGIPEGEEERIFEKFHRAPGAAGGGVGLGLAIARGIVEAHGGRIAAGPREGGGFRIAFSLPVPDTAPAPVPEGLA